MKKILKFQTGRGGRFFNPGFVTFVGFETITEGSTLDNHIYHEDIDKWFEDNGEELDCEINEDGTGYVQVDHDYDTTTCVAEDDLSDRQLDALKRADHWDTKEIERIIKLYDHE